MVQLRELRKGLLSDTLMEAHLEIQMRQLLECLTGEQLVPKKVSYWVSMREMPRVSKTIKELAKRLKLRD